MLFHQKLLIIISFVFCTVSAYGSSSSQLGSVDFATSGNLKAKKLFAHGLAALHSFWYDEALNAFEQSNMVDPNFVMGYWGQAMTYNKTLWEKQNIRAGKKVLIKIKDISKITARELSYLEAVMHLYGKGDKKTRDEAYAKANKLGLWAMEFEYPWEWRKKVREGN